MGFPEGEAEKAHIGAVAFTPPSKGADATPNMEQGLLKNRTGVESRLSLLNPTKCLKRPLTFRWRTYRQM
jgi:hypothetical protein